MSQDTARTRRELEDGAADTLVALQPLDPFRTDSASAMLEAMSRTSFSGRRLGEAADILFEMVSDPDCAVVATFAGAMTVAKMGTVILRMIETGMVQCVISTGALMSHGLSEGIGLSHFKADPRLSDEAMFEKGYNRVYDTLELEQNLNEVERFVQATLGAIDPATTLSSELVCRTLGKALAATGGPSILGAAYQHGVPVFIPAFTDCELGLDVATSAMRRRLAAAGAAGGSPADAIFEAAAAPAFNPFLDLLSYARFCGGKKRLGIFTIGGGVPRNWAQQVACFYDLIGYRLGVEVPEPRFQYGIRICPEPVHWGGLSGCTYSEGVSWGKFVSEREGGRFSEVYADATVAWPLLVRGVLERMGKVPARAATP
ncbi:MAG: deoxyhypusine synthase family protein [Polyangiaceae bacterium]|nr:deoxyhypusine synthase family protein [Polyangiaceae bacterium]